MNRNLTRWLMPALLTLSAVLAVAPAHAAWDYSPVKWRMLGRQAIGFSANNALIGGVDTTYVSAAAARADTTGEWSMLDAEPSPTGGVSIGGATADSTQVGAVVVCGDSTVASTFAWGATTVAIQVNYGQQSTGWTTIGTSISPLATTTQKALIAPMWNLPVATAHLGSTSFNATYNIFAPRVRAIVTWGTAAAVPSARVYVRKWVGSGAINIPVTRLSQGDR